MAATATPRVRIGWFGVFGTGCNLRMVREFDFDVLQPIGLGHLVAVKLGVKVGGGFDVHYGVLERAIFGVVMKVVAKGFVAKINVSAGVEDLVVPHLINDLAGNYGDIWVRDVQLQESNVFVDCGDDELEIPTVFLVESKFGVRQQLVDDAGCGQRWRSSQKGNAEVLSGVCYFEFQWKDFFQSRSCPNREDVGRQPLFTHLGRYFLASILL